MANAPRFSSTSRSRPSPTNGKPRFAVAARPSSPRAVDAPAVAPKSPRAQKAPNAAPQRAAARGAIKAAVDPRQTLSDSSLTGDKSEPRILFQKFFKSVGPRTYAAQVKELSNGNHVLVLTEGKRDEETDEVRKIRLFVYGEDFSQFFRMLHETAAFIRANPLSAEVRERRDKFWAKKNHRDTSRHNGNGQR